MGKSRHSRSRTQSNFLRNHFALLLQDSLHHLQKKGQRKEMAFHHVVFVIHYRLNIDNLLHGLLADLYLLKRTNARSPIENSVNLQHSDIYSD